MTQGEDMQEAYEMAVDALGLALTARENEKEPIPEASALDAVDGSERAWRSESGTNICARSVCESCTEPHSNITTGK